MGRSIEAYSRVSKIVYSRNVYMTSAKFVVIFCCAALPCFAQAGRAEMSGVVRDASGLPVPRASIEAEELGTKAPFRTTCGEHGEYHLLGLPVGQYVLTVEQQGFRTYRRSGIVLRIGDHVSLDIQLEVGSSTQSINVEEQVSLLQTASGSVNSS